MIKYLYVPFVRDNIMGNIILAGFDELCFVELFEKSQKVLDIVPGSNVQFMYKGYAIVVNDSNVYEAWDKFLRKEFKKLK